MKAALVLLAVVAACSAHLIAPVVPIQQGFVSSHQTIKVPSSAPVPVQQQAKVPAKQFGNYQFFVAQPPVQYQPQYQTIQYRPPYQYYQQQYYVTPNYYYPNYYYPTYYPFRR